VDQLIRPPHGLLNIRGFQEGESNSGLDLHQLPIPGTADPAPGRVQTSRIGTRFASIDGFGDHLHSCTQHVGAMGAHEHILTALQKLFTKAGYRTDRKNVPACLRRHPLRAPGPVVVFRRTAAAQSLLRDPPDPPRPRMRFRERVEPGQRFQATCLTASLISYFGIALAFLKCNSSGIPGQSAYERFQHLPSDPRKEAMRGGKGQKHLAINILPLHCYVCTCVHVPKQEPLSFQDQELGQSRRRLKKARYTLSCREPRGLTEFLLHGFERWWRDNGYYEHCPLRAASTRHTVTKTMHNAVTNKGTSGLSIPPVCFPITLLYDTPAS
jgi:hypothetical protein